MRVVSIYNLKGGVGKTTTATNLGGILATQGKRMLVVDNDQQGNTSQFFQVWSPEAEGTAEVLCLERNIKDVIQKVEDNISVLPSNINLAEANRVLMVNQSGMPIQIRLREALKTVADDYDICVIDNGPNLDFSFDNAMVASDDFIVPVKIDKYSFYGIGIMLERIKGLSYWNPNINFMGCLVTMQHNRNQLEMDGEKWLAEGSDITGTHKYKIMRTKIKYSPRVNDSTFASELITVKSKRSMAASNYVELAAEYLEEISKVSETDTRL